MDWYTAEEYQAHRLIFDRFSKEPFQKAYRRFSPGLPFSVDRTIESRLTRALFDFQRSLLCAVVDADLEQLVCPSTPASDTRDSLLYRKLSADDKRRFLDLLGDWQQLAGFAPAGGTDPQITRREALRYYCDEVLWRGAVNLDTDIRERFTRPYSVDKRARKFMSRNPAFEGLLQQSLDNFITTISTCLHRVADDVDALQSCFFDGRRITALTSLQSTGSDSHKGGAQVLILTFRFDSGPDKRLVYKPGDVEIDYRIAGSNTPAIKQWLQAKAADPGYPEPASSLFETLDAGVFAQRNTELVGTLSDGDKEATLRKLRLPVYRILPRNPGSGLQPDDKGVLPLRNSYGYIEYLPHEPDDLPVIDGSFPWEAISQLSAKQVSEADWLTASRQDQALFFRQWGRLAVIATLFCMSDLHHQNRRLRDKRLHLIDMENSLCRPISSATGTGITDRHDKLLVSDLAGFHSRLNGQGNTRKPVRMQAGSGNPASVATSLLLLVDRLAPLESGWKGLSGDISLRVSLLEGAREAIDCLGEAQDLLVKWVQQAGLAKVIVRHVLEPTAELSATLRGLWSRALNDRSLTLQQCAESSLRDIREKRTATWLLGTHSRDPHGRSYALNVMDYNGRDFLAGDIPSYYRRVGGRDLLTSRGEVVRFQAGQFTRLNDESIGEKRELGADEKQALGFEQFYPDTGIELLTASFRDTLFGLESRKQKRAAFDRIVFGEVAGKAGLGSIVPRDDARKIKKLLGRA